MTDNLGKYRIQIQISFSSALGKIFYYLYAFSTAVKFSVTSRLPVPEIWILTCFRQNSINMGCGIHQPNLPVAMSQK